MSFVVGLVANEESELVAKGVESGIVRVVAGADHIEVVSLENVKVFKHMIGGSSGAEDGMAVVAVCTVNLYLLTVDVYDSVLDLNGAETDVLNDVFITALDNEGVKLGILVAPESGIADEHFECTAAVKRDRSAALLAAFGVKELVVDLCLACKLCLNLENRLSVLCVDALTAIKIGNVSGITRKEIYFAEDARIAELVLILKSQDEALSRYSASGEVPR